MKTVLTLLLCTISLLCYGQKKTRSGPNIDVVNFDRKFEVAKWLFEYDQLAWQTSDSVMTQKKEEVARLGNEWFCYQDQGHKWHAVYGKYDNGAFDLVFHFTLDNQSKVKRTYEKVDTLLLNSYSRALITANKQIEAVKASSKIRFNQFVRQNDDKTFSVWILPAFQPNEMAVYGGEFIYNIDRVGKKILADNSYFQGNFRGFKVDPPREIWLNYRDVDKPTLGAIFFVWYYKQYFTSINIDCSKSFSTVFKADDGTYTWIHAEKELEKKKK